MCESIVHSIVLFQGEGPWVLLFSYKSPIPWPIISDPVWMAWLCGCSGLTEMNSCMPFKGHLCECESDIASHAFCFPPPHIPHIPRHAMCCPLLLSLLLCFPYGVSSVLGIRFFLLPFFMEGLDCLFSCLIFSLSTHLFI